MPSRSRLTAASIVSVLSAVTVVVVFAATGSQSAVNSKQDDSVAGTAKGTANGAEFDGKNNGNTTLTFDRGSAPGLLQGATQNGDACSVSGNQWHCGPFGVGPNGPMIINLISVSGTPFTGAITIDGISSNGVTDVFGGTFQISPFTPPPLPTPISPELTPTPTSNPELDVMWALLNGGTFVSPDSRPPHDFHGTVPMTAPRGTIYLDQFGFQTPWIGRHPAGALAPAKLPVRLIKPSRLVVRTAGKVAFPIATAPAGTAILKRTRVLNVRAKFTFIPTGKSPRIKVVTLTLRAKK